MSSDIMRNTIYKREKYDKQKPEKYDKQKPEKYIFKNQRNTKKIPMQIEMMKGGSKQRVGDHMIPPPTAVGGATASNRHGILEEKI